MSHEYFFKIKNPTKQDCFDSLSKIKNDERNGPDGELASIKELYSNFPEVYRKDHDFNLSLIQINCLVVAGISEPTEEMKLKSLYQNDWLIGYLPDQSEEFLTKAITKEPCIIEFLNEPSENLCLVAIKHNCNTFNFIPKKISRDPKFCLSALEQTPDVFPHIKICPVPDKETAMDNLNKIIKIIDNKQMVKNTIKMIE